MEQKWKIRLSANEDVRDFVRTAEKCDFDIAFEDVLQRFCVA